MVVVAVKVVLPGNGEVVRFQLAPDVSEGQEWKLKHWNTDHFRNVVQAAAVKMIDDRAAVIEGHLQLVAATLNLSPEEMAQRFTLCLRDKFEVRGGKTCFTTEFWLEPKGQPKERKGK